MSTSTTTVISGGSITPWETPSSTPLALSVNLVEVILP